MRIALDSPEARYNARLHSDLIKTRGPRTRAVKGSATSWLCAYVAVLRHRDSRVAVRLRRIRMYTVPTRLNRRITRHGGVRRRRISSFVTVTGKGAGFFGRLSQCLTSSILRVYRRDNRRFTHSCSPAAVGPLDVKFGRIGVVVAILVASASVPPPHRHDMSHVAAPTAGFSSQSATVTVTTPRQINLVGTVLQPGGKRLFCE